MVSPIFEPVVWEIEINNRKYPLNLYFDRVIRFMKLADNKEGLTDDEIADIAFSWFVDYPSKLALAAKIKVLEEIVNKYISTQSRRVIKNQESSVPVFDFEFDSAEIYASFMATYHIDLYEEQGKLHWHKFVQLFQGLPDDSRIKQIMNIRAEPIPAPTKYNRDKIQKMLELKAIHALPAKCTKTDKNAKSGFNQLFDNELVKQRLSARQIGS